MGATKLTCTNTLLAIRQAHHFQYLKPATMPSKAFSEMLPAVARIPRFWRRNFQRNSLSTISQAPPLRESLPLSTVFQSDAGRSYKVEEIIQDRGKPLLSIYRARHVYWLYEWQYWNTFLIIGLYSGEGEKYLVKHTLPEELEYQMDLQKRLILTLFANVNCVFILIWLGIYFA